MKDSQEYGVLYITSKKEIIFKGIKNTKRVYGGKKYICEKMNLELEFNSCKKKKKKNDHIELRGICLTYTEKFIKFS